MCQSNSLLSKAGAELLSRRTHSTQLHSPLYFTFLSIKTKVQLECEILFCIEGQQKTHASPAFQKGVTPLQTTVLMVKKQGIQSICVKYVGEILNPH